MAEVFALGHFFGFTAVANYATSIFKSAQSSILETIKNYDFSLLYSEKENTETKLQDAEKIVANWHKIKNVEKKKKAQVLSLELIEIKRKFETLRIKVDGYLQNGADGIELTDSFWNTYKFRILPLFILSGTFSVIMLLVAAFDELFKDFEFIHLNTYCGVCIVMFSLVIYNSSSKKINTDIVKQTIFLNTLLIGLTFLTIGLVSIMSNFTHLYPISLALTKLKLFFLILFSLALSGMPFLIILYKHQRLNYAAKSHSKEIPILKSRLSTFLQNVQKL